MKIILALLAFVLFNTALLSQQDTVPPIQNEIVEIYDVVAVYKSHTDGRGRTRQFTSELKGKILNYDESTGLLTFKGVDGRMFSFNSNQYEYFEYNKEFSSKKKKQKVLNPRKETGLQFSAGLSSGFLNIPTGLQLDENYVGGPTAGFDLPVCLKVVGSKYLNKNSLVGLTAEYSLLSSETSYFNAGVRYQYLYNTNKNASFYFPVELKFSHYQADYYRFQFNDTLFSDNGYTWPIDFESEVTINALELNVGQGISFALKNNRSLSIELMLLRQFILSEELAVPANITPPQTDFSVNGMKLSLFMNF
jgi:hypothetical protein